MKKRLTIKEALEKAIKEAGELHTRTDSKAAIAIRKLREDRKLTWEEFHRPITI